MKPLILNGRRQYYFRLDSNSHRCTIIVLPVMPLGELTTEPLMPLGDFPLWLVQLQDNFMMTQDKIQLDPTETAQLKWRENGVVWHREITLNELRTKWNKFDAYTTIDFEQRKGNSVWFDEHDRVCIGVGNDYIWYSSLSFQTSIEMAFTANVLFREGKTKAEVIDYLDENF